MSMQGLQCRGDMYWICSCKRQLGRSVGHGQIQTIWWFSIILWHTSFQRSLKSTRSLCRIVFGKQRVLKLPQEEQSIVLLGWCEVKNHDCLPRLGVSCMIQSKQSIFGCSAVHAQLQCMMGLRCALKHLVGGAPLQFWSPAIELIAYLRDCCIHMWHGAVYQLDLCYT